MIKLRKSFSIASFIGIGVVTVALALWYRAIALDALIEQETRGNTALARSFANSIGDRFLTFVDHASTLPREAILSHTETAAIDSRVRRQMKGTDVVKVKVYGLNGVTAFSTDPYQIGEDKSYNEGFSRAKAGKSASELTYRNAVYSFEGIVADRDLLATYLPIYHSETNEVAAVFELYSDVTPLVRRLHRAQLQIISGVVTILVLLYAFLYTIVARAERIIHRQTREQEESADKIKHQAYHDSLTSLPNRTMFLERLDEAVKRAKRTTRSFGVMFIDLDRFKVVNDSLGHDAGDRLLAIAAKRIVASVRESDTVFRMGGDEFTVLLENLAADEDAALVARRIIQSFTLPIDLKRSEVTVSASIGIAVYPRDDLTPERLIKDADAAMYRAKDAGRNRYQFFTEDMNLSALERLELENGLRKALRKEEFFLVYQPKVAAETGIVVGMEALLRWRHPEQGVIPPDRFLSYLEDSGLINPVGEWVIRRACLDVKQWIDEGLPPIRVSVNISSAQFRSEMLARNVAKILNDVGLNPRHLELELTESLLVENPDAAVRALEDLKKLGLFVSIDDFGTGYSSLNYLKQFPIDFLKIDRSFIRDLINNEKDAAITSAITALAHSLNLGLVAEGVEDLEQLEFLRSKGCQEIQGFLISKPVPIEELKARLIKDGHRLILTRDRAEPVSA